MWILKCIQQQTHPSWHALLKAACQTLPEDYLNYLATHTWLPGKDKIFNAFQLPLAKTQYILYGESPYPRQISANGFAFWDAAVQEIWSHKGLSKTVNRATSLRNLIKTLLIAEKHLAAKDLSIPTIAALAKENLVQTLTELFENFLQQGFLLLNASLALSALPKNLEARYWLNFHESLLEGLTLHCQKHAQKISLLLFGKIAEKITALPASQNFPLFIAEHPYNLSFIHNLKIQAFFSQFTLLSRK